MSQTLLPIARNRGKRESAAKNQYCTLLFPCNLDESTSQYTNVKLRQKTAWFKSQFSLLLKLIKVLYT